MKFFIVFAAALAVASAGHLVAPVAYHEQHLPVIGHNGVPVDTPAVQHATAAHLAHKAEAHARNGDYHVGHLGHVGHVAPVVAHAAPVAYAHAPVVAHAAPVVAAHAAHGVVAHVGVPETPEVVAAKHAHFAAHAEALARNGHGHHLHRRGIYAAAAPVVAHGVYAHVQPAAYPTTHVHPTSINGVPQETPEVVAAKSHHFAAHAEAHARNGDYHVGHPVVAAAYGAYPYAHAHGAYAYGTHGAYAYGAHGAHGAHHLGYAHY